MDWHVIIDNWPLLSKGVWVTVEIFVYTLVLGTALGIPLGVLRNSKIAAVRLPVFGIIEVFRGLPVPITLFFVFFAAPYVLHIDIPSKIAAVSGLTLWCMSEIAEVVRGALQSIPKGQTEAGKAHALTYFQILVWILLPQAFRRMLPPLIGIYNRLAKSTTLAALIGVRDLITAGQIVIERTMASLEIYLFIIAVFFILCYPFSIASFYLEKKLSR
ncbi:amino acid ABC transporter permease [Paenibacillus naphthalenovorans]|uniref:amino acid ABC transporter permease n=1 Tax=Paenibacillus naphthalenovorans TaxID=162209 RepID=UPI0010B79D7A|nr:amino acid ABC transporter permease [Paenibacillus naphthalenovorans]GCL72595.1 amino acid ABC transporter permease [Paenibacillus naphthalenovorans]